MTNRVVIVAWVLFGAGTGTFAISLVALNGASHRSPRAVAGRKAVADSRLDEAAEPAPVGSTPPWLTDAAHKFAAAAREYGVGANRQRMQPTPTTDRPPAAGVSTRAATEAAPANSSPTTTDPAAREAERRRQLDRRWAAHESNPELTDNARAYMGGALEAAHVPADRLKALECRGELCRIQMSFTSDDEGSALYQLRNPDYDLQLFRDAQNVTVFASRANPQVNAPQGQMMDDN